jgi:SAM-dependent methyltransferase
MARRRPSPFARRIAEINAGYAHQTVLDYGCGYGADVLFYRRAGLLADGYDPHPPFGWGLPPPGTYDVITMIFVLNVLPDPWQRLQALQSASTHLANTGRILVVCRSPRAIERHAHRGRWPPHNDGYWSSGSRGMFQRGISIRELLLLARRTRLAPLSGGGERGDTTELWLTRAV